ncbi:MAG TPA: class I SAM-dependent methyltransferase [Bryobacteraceae bacterium]|nr:class I SAM-dependent methyltransferase [Bryobacteraceae bacterium]
MPTAPPTKTASFKVIPRQRDAARWLARANAYALAMAYVKGSIDVEGDLIEAVRHHLAAAKRGWETRLMDAVCRWTPWRLFQGRQGRAAAARNIRFHYDRSNRFYRLFLDAQLVYSCAYFRREDDTLDQAQINKLDHICRKLRIQPGDRFLDIGCGWGALVLHAARRFGANATGCTLSTRQFEYAQQRIRAEGASNASVREADYRDVDGQYDKIASVGMFEHVGLAQLKTYFRRAYQLLAPKGLFLNHGITRPASAPPDSQSMFIARKVFPGAQLVRLDQVIHAAEAVGFEVLDVENLYKHYARTARMWVERLTARREECLTVVPEQTWRTWQLYLAGCSLAFEEGGLGLHQVLLAKRGAGAAPATRDDIYR